MAPRTGSILSTLRTSSIPISICCSKQHPIRKGAEIMLKALVNEAHLRLHITTTGPLLIKTGYATVIGADMAPVMTYHNGQQEVYIPGSSLKGVFRSHIEKVVNSIKPRIACNPLARTEDRRDDKQKLIEHRDGIAIDRLTGGVSGNAKFDLEVVTEGTTFTTDIHLRNFEIWQLGMLFVVFQDMQDELIRIGSGRSRGLGKVKASISELEEGSHQGGVVLSTMRTGTKQQAEPENELWGLGCWLAYEGEDEKTYRTRRDDLLILPQEVAHVPSGIRNIRVFNGETLNKLKEQSIESFVIQMEQWPDAPQVTAQRR